MPSKSQYIQSFPITVTIIIINVVVFIGIHLKLISFTSAVSLPQTYHIGTFLSHFSHVEWWHILMNMAIFYNISPLIESRLSQITYALIIFSIWIILAFLIIPFIQTPSLGFSGILLGLLAFATGLYWHVKQISHQLMSWIGLNILIGLLPMVSFIGHVGGVVAGGIVWGGYWIFASKR